MEKNVPLFMALLILGCSALIISLTLQLPEVLKWVLLLAAVVLNVSSMVGLMYIAKLNQR